MSLHLVTGDDPILRTDALDVLVDELLGSDDRTLALEDWTVPGKSEGAEARAAVVDSAVNAARTPPFMTEGRVVVLRDVGNLTVDEARLVVEYVDDPLASTALVLVAGGGRIPSALDQRIKDVGTRARPTSEKPADVLAAELDRAGLRLRAGAAETVRAHVGGDAGLVPGLVATLAAVHGDDADLDVDDVAPYLGGEGSIPPWDLTNAIEQGDVAGSLAVLHRLLTVTTPAQPKAMHPLQALALLHGHYRRLLRLDDPTVRTNEDAAAALGGRTSPSAARFRLRQARALGTDGLRQAFDYLARADLDLKGARAVPAEVVMEMLVARLAALTARVGGARGSPAGRRARRR